MNPKIFRNSFVYLLLFVAIGAILVTLVLPRTGTTERSLGWLIDEARAKRVQEIVVDRDALNVLTTEGRAFTVYKEEQTSIVTVLQDAGVEIGTGQGKVDVKPRSGGGFGDVFGLLINFLPLIFFGAVLLFMMRQAQGSNIQALNFGRSRARMFTGNRPSVTFADVAGVEEAKQELQEVVEFLKFPERFATLGARIPRGVLLVGPPGGGKTLLARAVSGEAGVPFFSISGSEFVEMFVGVGASRVRDLFDQAKRNAPCIVFVDEIDAVGRHRGAGLGGGHDEREQTLNQILVEMDGFDSSTNVIVLAATNRPDILDPALLRPGRFDRRVVVDLADVRGRRGILDVHVKGKPLAQEVDLDKIAKETSGFSGADLANLVNEAAILAARRSKTVIGPEEFAEAVERVVAGPERKSRVISAKEKKIVAYHEAGHALVARLLPNADTVVKVSIVARFLMGGYTRFLPEEERHLWSRAQFIDAMTAALGGHAAELITFGDVTTGASNDIEKATQIARKMVTTYGMSDKLGPRTFGKREEMIFLGREITEQRDYGEKVADEIDSEVQRLIASAFATAKNLLTASRAKLVQIAEKLMVVESIEGEDLRDLFDAPVPEPAPAT